MNLKWLILTTSAVIFFTYLLPHSRIKHSSPSLVATSTDPLLKPLALPASQCRQHIDEHILNDFKFSLNTSNAGKHFEFVRLFEAKGHNLVAITKHDLKEIDSSRFMVAIHKASNLPDMVIVEDSSLVVDGSDEIGVNLKWHMKNLDKYLGRNATLYSLIAYRAEGVVFAFEGKVTGKLVKPRGDFIQGSELYSYFQPENSDKTLAESLYTDHNPRQKALDALLNQQFSVCTKPLLSWQGPWQNEDK